MCAGPGVSPYTRSYTYDQGGNRTQMLDSSSQRRVLYTYDIDVPGTYESKNNRLMKSDTYSTTGGFDVLLFTTWYDYNPAGNPTRVIVDDALSSNWWATRMVYAKNYSAVAYVMGETWTDDGPDADSCPDNYTITYAREFRYDTGRARYMDRELDVSAATGLMRTPPIYTALATTWTDYDGDETYGDYTVSGGAVTMTANYDLGSWRRTGMIAGAGGSSEYLHGDLIGTLRNSTVAAIPGQSPPGGVGLPGTGRVFTAFGEPVLGLSAPDRYGYAGAWGYQAPSNTAAGSSYAALPFLHVGARYYDPLVGRFLQRDPIGILGRLNVYAYVFSSATKFTDSDGLIPDAGHNPNIPGDGPFNPTSPEPPISPRGLQKGAQWTATGCVLVIGVIPGGQIPATVIGACLLTLDILEYYGILPPAPDSW